MTSAQQRQNLLSLIAQACADGARLSPACRQIGLCARSVQRWQRTGAPEGDQRKSDKRRYVCPPNKLREEERQAVMATLNSEAFKDLPPSQIVPRLADSGVYVRGPQLQVRDFIRRKEMLKQLTKFKNDDWNELDITVKNGVVTTVVNGKALTEKDSLNLTVQNGKPVANLNGKSVDINKIEVSVGAVAKCLCNGEFMENMKIPQKSAQGIGLQAETGKFEFRRIRIKETP